MIFYVITTVLEKKCLTVIIEEAFGFLICSCGDDCSDKYIHYGHQQDDE